MEVAGSKSSAFDPVQTSVMVRETVTRLIGRETYEDDKVNQWTVNIIDSILTQLTDTNPKFKYIASIVRFFDVSSLLE